MRPVASVDKRPNGRWRARWREYPGGPQRARHFPRKVDAEQFLTKVGHDLLSGAYVDPRAGQVTLEQWVGEWLCRQHWRESTRSGTTRRLTLHVLPVLGARPLATIKRGDIDALLRGLKLQPSTVAGVRSTLASVFRAAVEDGLLARSPVVAGRVRERAKAPAKALRDEQVVAVLAACPDWYRSAVVLGLGAGLRQGEAAGLSVDRVDFLRRTVTVDRQWLTPEKGDPHFGPPKSQAGFRTIPVDQWLLDELAAHLARFGEGEHGLACHRDGKALCRSQMGAAFRQASAPVLGATYHALRHTYASNLLSAGVSVKAVADWLGHSNPSVTLSIYAHVMPRDDERGRAVMAAAAERWALVG